LTKLCDRSIIVINILVKTLIDKGITMFDFISAYFSQWFDSDSNLHEYGSDLEQYILAHNPQSIHDVEQLTKQFENTLTQGK
jgi:predicted oxidoreductase